MGPELLEQACAAVADEALLAAQLLGLDLLHGHWGDDGVAETAQLLSNEGEKVVLVDVDAAKASRSRFSSATKKGDYPRG